MYTVSSRLAPRLSKCSGVRPPSVNAPSSSPEILIKYEPPRGKTNNVVSKQAGYNPACTVTKDG